MTDSKQPVTFSHDNDCPLLVVTGRATIDLLAYGKPVTGDTVAAWAFGFCGENPQCRCPAVTP